MIAGRLQGVYDLNTELDPSLSIRILKEDIKDIFALE